MASTPIITNPEKAPKKRLTDAERAQYAYDVAERIHSRALSKVHQAKRDLAEAEAEVAGTNKRLAYAKANPDLPQQTEDVDLPAQEAADE